MRGHLSKASPKRSRASVITILFIQISTEYFPSMPNIAGFGVFFNIAQPDSPEKCHITCLG